MPLAIHLAVGTCRCCTVQTLHNLSKYQPPRLAAVYNLCADMKALGQERAARALRTKSIRLS